MCSLPCIPNERLTGIAGMDGANAKAGAVAVALANAINVRGLPWSSLLSARPASRLLDPRERPFAQQTYFRKLASDEGPTQFGQPRSRCSDRCFQPG